MVTKIVLLELSGGGVNNSEAAAARNGDGLSRE
jgi:hypothetical protein